MCLAVERNEMASSSGLSSPFPWWRPCRDRRWWRCTRDVTGVKWSWHEMTSSLGRELSIPVDCGHSEWCIGQVMSEYCKFSQWKCYFSRLTDVISGLLCMFLEPFNAGFNWQCEKMKPQIVTSNSLRSCEFYISSYFLTWCWSFEQFYKRTYWQKQWQMHI